MDNENSNPTSPQYSWRSLFWVTGPLMMGSGITVLLERWSGNSAYIYSWPSLVLIVLGIILVVLAKIFHPKIGNNVFQALTRWANSPIPYAVILFLFWVSFETQQVIGNNEILTLRNDQQAIAKVIERLVLPRRLTDFQKKEISMILRRYGPHQYSIRVSRLDNEAMEFAGDIQQALNSGKWTFDPGNFYNFVEDEKTSTGPLMEGLRVMRVP